jgi:hypothetical protein
MRRWEAFVLAAQVQAAGTRYEVCGIRLRKARCQGHEVTVRDAWSGRRLALSSLREWHEVAHRDEIEHLATRVRWAEPVEGLRGDLVAEYERLSIDLGIPPQAVHDPPELCQALEALVELSS